MSRVINQLGQLERLARIKADRELRRFAAFRAQSQAMAAQINAARGDLAAAAAVPVPDLLTQWQMTTAIVGYHAHHLHRAEAEMERLRPGLDAARTAAALAFGRAEALAELRRLTIAQDRNDRQRKQE